MTREYFKTMWISLAVDTRVVNGEYRSMISHGLLTMTYRWLMA